MSGDEHGGPPASCALDRARVLVRVAAPDNLVWQDEHLLFSSGAEILVIDGVRAATAVPEPILHFEAVVSALAGAPDGSLAVGLGVAGIRIVGGARDGLRITVLGAQPLVCPTALCFATPDVLFVCQGSASQAPQDWRHDGSLWRLDLSGGEAICLGAGLAHPNGLLLDERAGRIVISEGGDRRLLAFGAVGPRAPQLVCDGLPAYPGRMAPAGGEGAWLALSARPGEDALALRLDHLFRPSATLRGGWRGVGSCLEVQGNLLLACRDSDALIVSDLPRRAWRKRL